MSDRKLFARVMGRDDSITVNASSVVVSQDTIIRDLNLQLGRIFSHIQAVEFLTLDDKGKEVKLASATTTDDHWKIVYTSKALKAEEIERTTTRKTGDNWKDLPIAKARNLGPDMMILTTHVAGKLEFKAKVVKSETKAIKAENETLKKQGEDNLKRIAELEKALAALKAQAVKVDEPAK